MFHYLRNIYAIGFSSYVKILIKWKHLKKAGSITVNPSIIKMTKVLLNFFTKRGKNPPWFLTLKYQNKYIKSVFSGLTWLFVTLSAIRIF